MSKKRNLLERLILKMIQLKVRHWFNLEKELVSRDTFIRAAAESPEKTWPDPEKIPGGEEIPFSMQNMKVVGKYLRSCIREGVIATRSLKDNGKEFQQTMTTAQLHDFTAYAASLGVDKIGYTRIPEKLIFKERAVCFDNAIVLIKEMDKDAISRAPSLVTLRTVFETYDTLGIITNKLTDYLRKNNFYAQASHPLGGLVLYPPLAQKAGLGWLGKHGLLITPEFGSRQRISAIFTSISNLPFSDSREHQWIERFCNVCNRCIRKCPPEAIYNDPVIHPSGRETHIDRSRCLPYFNENYGCSVCLKECVFSSGRYEEIKNKFMKTEEERTAK